MLSGVLAAFGLLTIVFSYAMGNQVPAIAIVALVLTGITALFLFQGWGRVLGAAQVGAQRAGPPAQKLWQKAKGNVAGTLAIIGFCFCLLFTGLAIGYESKQWAEAAFLAILLTAGFSIAHFLGAQHVVDHWKAYWLGLSLYGMFHVVAFEYDVVILGAFAISALMATITLCNGWGAVGSLIWFCIRKLVAGFVWAVQKLAALGVRLAVWAIGGIAGLLSKLLSGTWGWDSALFGWSMLLLLIGLLFVGISSLSGTLINIQGAAIPVAEAVLTASFILFLVSVVVFMNTRIKGK